MAANRPPVVVTQEVLTHVDLPVAIPDNSPNGAASRTAPEWTPSPESTGAFAKYARLVGSASHGAVTNPV